MQQYGHESRLVTLGANVAGLTEAAVGLTLAMVLGGAGAAWRLTGAIWASPHHDECGCGCHTVHHHYYCVCVPPCHGCRG